MLGKLRPQHAWMKVVTGVRCNMRFELKQWGKANYNIVKYSILSNTQYCQIRNIAFFFFSIGGWTYDPQALYP